MPSAVSVRTAAGGLLSLEITPADVLDRCSRCRVTYREGDLYCSHLQARYGHQVALLADRHQAGTPAAAEPADGGRARLAAVFQAPLADAVSA